jgi:hypothetical protein
MWFRNKKEKIDFVPGKLVKYENKSISDIKPDIAFITCIEQGFLVEQSLMLYESIRKFTGRFSKCPIYAFSPRKGKDIDRRTKRALKKLNVIHINEILNDKLSFFDWANKVYVCAYAELNFKNKVLVWVDSDKIFFREPNELELDEQTDIALRPVYWKVRYYTTGIEDKFDECWHYLCKNCNVGYKKMPYVNTQFTNQMIKACYNSGLVPFRREKGISEKWVKDTEKMVDLGYDPRISDIWRSNQPTLSTAIYGITDRVKLLSDGYSYNPQKKNKFAEPQVKFNSTKDITSVHYHLKMNNGIIKHNLLFSPGFIWEDELYQWIKNRIPFSSI